MLQKLKSLKPEFKAHHQAFIYIVDNESDLQKKQDLLE